LLAVQITLYFIIVGERKVITLQQT